MSLPDLPEEVDIIVVGGGPAGIVISTRLASATSSLKILLIEAGGDSQNIPTVQKPALYLWNLAPDSKTVTFYMSRPNEHVAGRSVVVPVGNILGGGSAVNMLMYTRPLAADFDDWLVKGWAFEDVLPYFKKFETYYDKTGSATETHGYDGPVHVSNGNAPQSGLFKEFYDACEKMGYPPTNDANDFHTVGKISWWRKWIHPESGTREDAAKTYLHKHPRSNLQVALHTKVAQVLVKDGKAVGVTVVPSTFEGKPEPVERTILARKLVVLSAGTLSTPQILERSGVGDPKVLNAAGIETKVNLPGVGNNFQDHDALIPTFHVDPTQLTWTNLIYGDKDVHEQAEKDLQKGHGMFTTNFIDVGGKVRPNEDYIKTSGPEFRDMWETDYKDSPSRPLVFLGFAPGFVGDLSNVDPKAGTYASIGGYLEYPKSRGSVHITTSSPYAVPDFDGKYISHPADLDTIRFLYKESREVARRMPSYRGEVKQMHPKFSPTSQARIRSPEDYDTWYTTGNLVYTDEDERAIEQHIREHIGTCWHPIGTCSMRPRKTGGVVDSNLNVYGVKNLKIADLSILPEHVCSNTNSVAYMVGEKAAAIIAQDLDIDESLLSNERLYAA